MKGLISEMLAQRTMSMEASGVQPPGAFQMPLAPPLHVNVSGVWAKETPTVRKVAAATSHAVMGMKRSLIESLCVCIIDSLWFRGLCRHSCLCPFIVVPVNLKTQPHSFMKEFHSFAFQHPEERLFRRIGQSPETVWKACARDMGGSFVDSNLSCARRDIPCRRTSASRQHVERRRRLHTPESNRKLGSSFRTACCA